MRKLVLLCIFLGLQGCVDEAFKREYQQNLIRDGQAYCVTEGKRFQLRKVVESVKTPFWYKANVVGVCAL